MAWVLLTARVSIDSENEQQMKQKEKKMYHLPRKST